MIWQLIPVSLSFGFPESSSSCSTLSALLLPNDFLLLPDLLCDSSVCNTNTSPLSASGFSGPLSSDSLCLFDVFPDLLRFFLDLYESDDDDSDDDDDDSEELLISG